MITGTLKGCKICGDHNAASVCSGLKACMLFKIIVNDIQALSPEQTDAALLDVWMLDVASVCTPCYTLLGILCKV